MPNPSTSPICAGKPNSPPLNAPSPATNSMKCSAASTSESPSVPAGAGASPGSGKPRAITVSTIWLAPPIQISAAQIQPPPHKQAAKSNSPGKSAKSANAGIVAGRSKGSGMAHRFFLSLSLIFRLLPPSGEIAD